MIPPMVNGLHGLLSTGRAGYQAEQILGGRETLVSTWILDQLEWRVSVSYTSSSIKLISIMSTFSDTV